ncbi:MAG: galactose oxidase early set domain-containing protein [Nitrosomonas sp.]
MDAPSSSLTWDQEFPIEGSEAIHHVTLLRLGAVTHNIDVEARFFELPLLLPASNLVSVKTPTNANLAPPGFYQVFIWNSEGVPSIAKILQIH